MVLVNGPLGHTVCLECHQAYLGGECPREWLEAHNRHGVRSTRRGDAVRRRLTWPIRSRRRSTRP